MSEDALPDVTHQSKKKTKHGMSRTAEYRIFQGMHQRCNNPKNPEYKDYGARGIKVDARWDTFVQFFTDVGLRPSPAHSLDRYPDNNGPYSPENTRWATHVEQHRNNRRNRVVTVDGETRCLSEWAERTGISQITLRARVETHKPPEDYFLPGGRAQGERNGNARLTEDQAKALYALKGTMKQRDAGQLFGVSQTCVRFLWNQWTWKHIHIIPLV